MENEGLNCLILQHLIYFFQRMMQSIVRKEASHAFYHDNIHSRNDWKKTQEQIRIMHPRDRTSKLTDKNLGKKIIQFQ